MIALAVIYRVGRPGTRKWRTVLPGAVVATLLWWVVSAGFGLYMRHVPYGEIYGGLTAVIGLMIWMQLTATIILIGDAYNAESLCNRNAPSIGSR
jgi:membrane protein